MRVFIPPELMGLARELDIQKWVEGRRWPRDRYFQMVDRCRTVLAILGDDAMDNPEAIAYQLAAALRVDQPYQEYILTGRGVNMGDGKEWFDKCLAAAWAIVQRYNKEVNNLTWKADL